MVKSRKYCKNDDDDDDAHEDIGEHCRESAKLNTCVDDD